MAGIASNSIIVSLTRIAFANKEFPLLLLGKGRYKCDMNPFVPANAPTDWDRIIEHGIYALYKEKNDTKISDAFKDAICQLLREDAVHVWVAYSVIWSQFYNEQKGSSPFKIIDSGLLKETKDALFRNEHKLKSVREWQGASEPDGLWQDVIRTNDVLKKKFGVAIL